MSKGLIIFIEGDTEEVFYAKLLDQLHKFAPSQKFQVDKLIVRNLKGISNYKIKAKRVFEKDIKHKYPGMNFTIVLCYDTDVFEYTANPAVVWSEVDKALKQSGAEKVIHVKAKRSIEDWFLLDMQGVVSYLGLSENKKSNGRGAEILKALFLKAGKIYAKGAGTKAFVESLDFNLIIAGICPELKKLCKELGIKCKTDKCRGGE